MDQHPIKNLKFKPTSVTIPEPEESRGYLSMGIDGSLRTRVSGHPEINIGGSLSFSNQIFLDPSFDESTPGFGTTTFNEFLSAASALNNTDTILIVSGVNTSYSGGPTLNNGTIYIRPNSVLDMGDQSIALHTGVLTLYGPGEYRGYINVVDSAKLVGRNIELTKIIYAEPGEVDLQNVSGSSRIDTYGDTCVVTLKDSILNRVSSYDSEGGALPLLISAHNCVLSTLNSAYFNVLNHTNSYPDGRPIVLSALVADLPAAADNIGAQAMTTDGGTAGVPAMMGSNGTSWVVVWE